MGKKLIAEFKENRKFRIAVIAAAVVIAAAAAFFLIKGRKKSSFAGGMPGGYGMMANASAGFAMVKAAKPYTGNVSVTSALTGTVEAAEAVYVNSKTSGDVISVNVRAGDTVKEGDLLLQIDTGNVESAKNSLESAEISLNQAKSNLSRMEILHDAGDITEQEWEQYNNNVKTSQIQYNNALLNYNTQVENSVVSASINGKVESVSVEVHDHVNNNQELCVIAGEGKKRVVFDVSERIMQSLRTGDELKLVKNGQSIPAKITEVSTIVDSTTGMFRCKAELDDTDRIAIGSNVKVELVSGRSENVMLVPVDAIYYSGGDAYLYTVVNGKAKMTYVEVGLYDDKDAEIISGITAEDMVVSTWSKNLYEGADVRVLDEQGNEIEMETVPETAGDGSAEGKKKRPDSISGQGRSGGGPGGPGGMMR